MLDAAEDAGVLMPSGCRMGICFGCVLPMTDGSVRDLRTGELTTTTPDDPAVKVQTCISAVAGSCTIETTES
ncbi:2Fe-2S iron-sulfur cluster-binding protein [Janibacter hoylei]|uniref:2Fe-2S iron-sulfur cluster-binding protein n=1 Tax=Janibacter hoylei TaxID=364298 RepID=UPI0022375D82|nr:2Fe-2S iron-sulfur cluster-binding protein [Janibacter hoylei]MCW4602514.1 2Fe-2S iron-sulfur cluster-binding protein [Janibacter hoylei]